MGTRAVQGAFESYLATKHLKHSRPRQAILEAVLRSDQHLTAEEIHRRVRRHQPGIGFATVYRTLKLLCESGLCRELKFEGKAARYERGAARAHHDHLICTRCGVLVEVVDPEIERLQERLFARHGFAPQRHRMELYGLCRSCRTASPGRA